MKHLLILSLLSLPLAAQTPGTIHATAQCESVNSNVLGITLLKDCTIGVTNYGPTQVIVTQTEFREWFPDLDIENAQRAQAVGDKAFNSSKTSKIIAAINFVSPLTVALMGGGLLHAGIEAIAAVSLANTAAQSYKNHLISLQPNEAAFLPTCQSGLTLAPYGTQGFSQECTVLGSIDYTTSPVVTPTLGRLGAKPAKGMASRGRTLIWNGDLPSAPQIPPHFAPGAFDRMEPAMPAFPAAVLYTAVSPPVVSAPAWEAGIDYVAYVASVR